MASKLPQIKTAATQATQFIAKNATQASQYVINNGPTYYKNLLEKNKHYIKEPATVETCVLLAKQHYYTNLASIPSRYEAFWKELEAVKNVVKNRQVELSLDKAGIAALFGVECFAWFCGGEIIGRGFTITGYKV